MVSEETKEEVVKNLLPSFLKIEFTCFSTDGSLLKKWNSCLSKTRVLFENHRLYFHKDSKPAFSRVGNPSFLCRSAPSSSVLILSQEAVGWPGSMVIVAPPGQPMREGWDATPK